MNRRKFQSKTMQYCRKFRPRIMYSIIHVQILLIVISWSSFNVEAARNNYLARWDRMEIINQDLGFINITGSIKFYNRTVKALYIDAEVFTPMTETSLMRATFAKWINNQWHAYSALAFTETTKRVINMEWFDAKRFFKSFDPPVYAWVPGTYRLRDFVFNTDKFPPYLPIGTYRADLEFFYTKKMVKPYFTIKCDMTGNNY